ncbi:4-diphosphocytidyl-2C-methyl-D-erythritol kinase [Chloroflexus islandicus]|uniref:4-diphosphocytidyl-2C-methyl-D-erythritol kinase n=1 Tax=Chloroflexus islandicus TaxID=1707952 RepID=A0A178MBR0_9CHLR|nr:nucleotidyltransferase family protein [Chloroflexus islandicus]OAN45475.1 4-diphosphocytidyl-2C-methyl-D-erythritol kinase [Chloroflexus islandicus]
MKIAGLLLAAGQSTRMGQPKQLLDWQGRPLVAHIAAEALASQLAGLTVVVGAAEAQVRAALRDLPVQIVTNPAYAEGLGSSLGAGLRALPADADAAMVVLVDQPLVTARLMNELIDAYRTAPATLALVPVYRGQRGNPVIVAAALFAELQTLRGDTGARAVFNRYAGQIIWYETNDPAVVTDADTPEAWRALQG